MKESQINFVNSSASKKKLHSQAGNKLNQARKIKSIFIMIQERTNLSFFFFFPFLAISVEELSGSGWHFSNLMFIRIPNAPPILIFLLSPAPYAFSISQRFSRVFSRCVLLYFTNPRFLFVSYPTGGAPLSYIPVTDPSPLPVFLLQLYSAFPFEIFVEISY